jgi:multicomponent Na+:H+ antiporter subunit D
MPIVYRAFFKEPDDTNDPHADHGEAPLPVVIALTATALGTILLFFFSGLPLELAHQVIGK